MRGLGEERTAATQNFPEPGSQEEKFFYRQNFAEAVRSAADLKTFQIKRELEENLEGKTVPRGGVSAKLHACLLAYKQMFQCLVESFKESL